MKSNKPFKLELIDRAGNSHDLTDLLKSFTWDSPKLPDVDDFLPLGFSVTVKIDPIDALVLIPPRNDAELS